MSTTINYRENVLLVEGGDDKIFSEKLLTFHSISTTNLTIDEGKSEYSGAGYDGLLKKVKVIHNVVSNFTTTVKKLFIAVDADQDGCQVKFDQIIKQLDTNVYTIPLELGNISTLEPGKIQTAIYVFPDNYQNGILESLCLPTVKEQDRLEPINNFLDSLLPKNMWDTPENRKDKSRLQMYLATRKEPHVGLGQAIRNQEFNLAHQNFHQYLNFLRLLIED